MLTATASPDRPSASVSINGGSFRGGETVAVGFEVKNPSSGSAADLYLGVILPDGHTMVLFTSGELSVPSPTSTPRE